MTGDAYNVPTEHFERGTISIGADRMSDPATWGHFAGSARRSIARSRTW